MPSQRCLKRSLDFWGVLIAMATLAPALEAQSLTLVRDGQPTAAIVAQAEPGRMTLEDYEQKVMSPARDLQGFIERISGAKLPLLIESAVVPPEAKAVLYVGHTAAARRAGVVIPSGYRPGIRPDVYDGEEGFIIKTVGTDIFLAGNQDGPYQGTAYAVYRFLETLGCRWYFPGEWGQVIPGAKTVTVPDLDMTSRPDFPLRIIWIDGRWGGMDKEQREIYATWCRRVGFSAPALHNGFYPVPGDGFLAAPLPLTEYAQTHPEFYAMDEKGQRQADPKLHFTSTMLCLSNEDMVKEYIKNVGEAFSGARKISTVTELGIGISPPDGTPYCYCDHCRAASRDFNFPRYVHKTMQSEEVFEFANKVAAAFPDKWVSVAGYALRDLPPQGVDLLPNISVMQAPISNCVLHPNHDPTCWRRAEFVKYLRHWRRLTPHLWLYDYNPGFLVSDFEPERDVANFAVNAPIYKEIGLKGFARQGSNAMMASWISYYTSARLMWDVRADVAALKRDFYDTFFGPAAGPHVQAWWDACEDRLLQGTLHVHESWLVNHLYTADFARSLRHHLEAAKASAMNQEQRQRLAVFADIVENFEAAAEVDEALKELDYRAAVAAAERILAARRRLHAVSPFLVGPKTFDNKGRFNGLGRKLYYESLLARTNGSTGTLVAPLPLQTRFQRDPFNVGITSEWYLPDFDDRGWGVKNTFHTWDAQDPPEDDAGQDYDGYGWYRTTVTAPADLAGKPVRFRCNGALNQAWVWINGRFVGRSKHSLWWMGDSDFELDVTGLLRPGENTIAIRVFNDAEVGGLFNRAFFWSPMTQP